MLHINQITYRVGGRLILDGASAALPEGHKIGLVGRNGTGKTTLLRLITGEIGSESGSIGLPKRARIGTVAQEAPGGPESLIAVVLAGHEELTALEAEAHSATDPDRIAEIQMRLADIDAHSAPARAASILSGLGFTDEQQRGPCSALSGGWRMRVALGAALFSAPDVLLLDEPTNYLDLEGTIWLKNFIRNYRNTILMVSHDRDLLNEAVDSILHLQGGKLTIYTGNYDTFERIRREKQALNAKMKKKQDDARQHLQSFIDRFKAKASKATQAQSRIKALAKMEPIAEMLEEHVAPFHFPSPEKPLNPPLIRFENASVGYNGTPILRGISLRVDEDDRIALLGMNGNGKSTFAKLICGKLEALSGKMITHNRLEVGYFAQHQLDELGEGRTAYDYFRELMPDASEASRRAKLGAIGFGKNLADSTCATLSGGEKARLLFALAAFKGPHVMVLDEPTNHLDVDAREALIHAMNEYEGAIILISHDRHLIETSVDRLLLVADGKVSPFDGDLQAYTNYVLERAKAMRRGSPAPVLPSEKSPEPVKTAEKKPAPQALKKRAFDLEGQIAKIQEKLNILDAALADATIYRENPKQAEDFARLRVKLAADLEAREMEWLEVQEEMA
jgi:ATP-binding cassette, subfamily F, member 3